MFNFKIENTNESQVIFLNRTEL